MSPSCTVRLAWYARSIEEGKDPDLPDALRRTLDRLGRRTLAAVSRYAASRLGAMGGVKGGKKAWEVALAHNVPFDCGS